MKKLVWILAVLLLAVSTVVVAADDDLAVVVNKANATDSLTKSQLRKLVLGEQGSWPGGAKVALILGPQGSPERDGALKSVCRMTEDEFNQHQMLANFSGETAGAAKTANSSAAVLQMVASTPGGIGFLRPADVNNTVKVVSVDGAVAGQPDYKIKAGK